MELIYLWVEDYKNIQKQGFNFSPKFRCDYNPDTNELTIDENDEYMSIFPENINVTAIVGKNGSGKSSLLEVLSGTLSTNYKTSSFRFDGIGDNFFLIYKNGNSYYSLNKEFTPDNRKIIGMNKFHIQYDGPQKLFELDKNLVAILMNNELTNILTFDKAEQLFIASSQLDINHIQEIICSNFMNNRNDTFNKDTDKFFIPTKIKIYSLCNVEEINNQITYLLSKEDLSTVCINNNIKLLEEEFYREPKHIFDKFNINATTPLYTFNIDDIDEKKLKKIFSLKNDLIDVQICNDTKNFKDLSYGERQLLANLNFILYYSTLREYEETKYWNDEKTGEQKEHLNKVKVDNIIILLDEFELGLHPNWQKRTIQYIIDFLSLITVPSKKFHLIFTTHSPFLLSDIPKQNIIFLDTYKKEDEEVKNDKQKVGNCKVVDGLSQTFGANIHTLLSDSFFMEDGLMGEFAKGKINNVIKFLKNEKSDIKDKNEAKKIIEIIGEPFLKQKLEQMYYEQYPKSNDELIKEYEDKIKELKNANTKNR